MRWETVARRTEHDGRAQARVLLQLVHEMLGEVGGGPGDLAALVAGIGPGTFTGVRIAVATARALSLALEVPVVGVSTLAALAAEAVETAGGAQTGGAAEATGATGVGATVDFVVPVVDARRGQVFYSLYSRVGGRAQGTGPWERRKEPAACGSAELVSFIEGLSRLSEDRPGVQATGGLTLVIGDAKTLPADQGPHLCRVRSQPAEVAAEWLVRGQERLQEPGVMPAGRRLGAFLEGALVGRQLPGTGRRIPEPGEVGTPEAVRPIYVRAPDADIHITKMRDPWKSA